MRIDVLGLHAFVTIADRGSFRAAASHLNLSQTALSHRIRKLEDALKTRLLTRTTRQVSLTPTGAALLPRARKVFDELGAALEELGADEAPAEEYISMGCLPTIALKCLPAALAAFARAHPNARVRVHDNSASEIAERVQSGEAEFAVTIVAANRWDLELKPLVKEPFVLVCSRGQPLARAASLAWAEIVGLPLIRSSAEAGNRVLIDDALGARSETLSWRYEVQRVVTAFSLARSGVGYAIAPRLAFDVADEKDLVAIPLRAPTIFRPLGVTTRRGAPLSPLASHLLKLLTAALRESFGPVNEHS